MPNTNVFTLDEINQVLEQLNAHPGARLQYIGSRYVPIFGRKGEDSIEWDNSGTYEPLTIVLYQGNSYTSRQFVPAGIDIANDQYWIETGNYNAQIEQYRQEVLALNDNFDSLNKTVENGITYSTPEMFGASGDGMEDDSEALKSAIESGKIVMCSNKYKVNCTLSNCTIIGGEFIANDNSKPVFIVNNDVTLIGITIKSDNSSESNDARGIDIESAENVIIFDADISNISRAALLIANSNNVSCHGIKIHDCGNEDVTTTVFEALYSSMIKVDGLKAIDNNGEHVLFRGCNNVSIENVEIDKQYGNGCAITLETCSYAKIENSVITNSNNSGIELNDCDNVICESCNSENSSQYDLLVSTYTESGEKEKSKNITITNCIFSKVNNVSSDCVFDTCEINSILLNIDYETDSTVKFINGENGVKSIAATPANGNLIIMVDGNYPITIEGRYISKTRLYNIGHSYNYAASYVLGNGNEISIPFYMIGAVVNVLSSFVDDLEQYTFASYIVTRNAIKLINSVDGTTARKVTVSFSNNALKLTNNTGVSIFVDISY